MGAADVEMDESSSDEDTGALKKRIQGAGKKQTATTDKDSYKQ